MPYYLRVRGRVSGPFDLPKLRQLQKLGQLKRTHQISMDGQTWGPAGSITDLFGTASDSADGNGRPDSADGPPAITIPQPEPAFPDEPAAAPARSSFSSWWLVAAAGVLVVAAGSVTTLVLTGRVDPRAVLNPAVIANLQDPNLRDAVGMVVCYHRVTMPNGQVFEGPNGHDLAKGKDIGWFYGHGTSFAVTSEGHLITNKHVVESIHNDLNAKLRWEKLREEKQIDVQPIVAVFFRDGKERYNAQIVHISSDHDLALLKIDRRGGPYFRLTRDCAKVEMATDAYAVGFPGAGSEVSLSKKDIKLELLADTVGDDIQKRFLQRQFQFSITKGNISRIALEEGGTLWVQHTAVIHPGNSGGPLVLQDASVVGINTLGLVTKLSGGQGSDVSIQTPGIYFSVPAELIGKEFSQYVPNLAWR